jgi:hypothetical protein
VEGVDTAKQVRGQGWEDSLVSGTLAGPIKRAVSTSTAKFRHPS